MLKLMTLLLVSSMTVMASATISSALPPIEASDTNDLEQVPAVSQFSDVQPTDWAFAALRSLVERYGIISGYADGTYRGNRAMSRYEFAAGLNVALEQINRLIAEGTADAISPEDFALLQRLQAEFAAELTTLRSRVNQLEAKTNELAANQFSTTTKLSGQVVFAVNAGGYTGDRIIAPRGAVIAENQLNPTVIYRFSLNFNTSFTGKDLLQVRLITGSGAADDNTAGFLEPNLASTLDFSIPGRNDQISLARLYYTLPLSDDLSLTLGPSITAPDFVDKNRYANTSFLDFSTQALVNNYVLFPRARGTGALLAWNPGAGTLHLRAVYIAGDANNTLPENAQVFGGGRPQDIRLFPVGGGGATGGLFGDPYQGIVELEYAPNQAFALRLQYGGGRIFGSDFNALGINFDLTLSDRLGLFGRYGYSSYTNTTVGDIHPNYWMAGIAFPNLFMNRAIAGIAIGQPLIENAVGNATQTNFEAFYNFPLTDQIRITPLMQVITNPGNQNANGTIITGTMRMVFSF
ncbi:MAG: iron uptake porin [Goleter apudmare HA4340-LM2]|jgi:porin|nr:iron uptake porin [Goleter apudmare HA4340-LM2]